ncbi:hypothetical protein BY996DRAFT_6419538 [Phakopsora pachyrhizi]|nr:hypothetical protein BY996DRAFT_6429019 [Phakopsora pachyrhizi]KAI8448607.1 hypothetical protein BY996DRAFT_6419538 [Phakopsora pachyrhizi]
MTIASTLIWGSSTKHQSMGFLEGMPFLGSAASATLTAIRASISQKFKPAAISSFVLLSSNSCSSALAASHKRSASPPIKLSDPPQVTHRDFEHYLHQIQAFGAEVSSQPWEIFSCYILKWHLAWHRLMPKVANLFNCSLMLRKGDLTWFNVGLRGEVL